MGRLLVVVKLICSLGHCECDGHKVHSLSQWRLTADWLAPREIDCSQMHSKVSSDWLPSYITATQTVLEIFKMAGYFSGQTSYLRYSAFFFFLWRVVGYPYQGYGYGYGHGLYNSYYPHYWWWRRSVTWWLSKWKKRRPQESGNTHFLKLPSYAEECRSSRMTTNGQP